MRRSLTVLAATMMTLVICSDVAQAATSPAEPTDPVSLSGSLTPFVWGLVWAVVSLAVFGLFTRELPSAGVLKDAPGTWSLPDSWITTVTGASAGLLALLGASDALTALLGEEPEAAVAKLVIIGALSALFVALGPMVAAILTFGNATKWWSVVVSALFTLTGAMGLVVGIWSTFAGAQDPSPSLASLGGVMAIAVEVIIGAYAAVTLHALVKAGPSSESITMVGTEVMVRKRSWVL